MMALKNHEGIERQLLRLGSQQPKCLQPCRKTPGETKIEIDRRRIRSRMVKLRQQIAGFLPAREAKRAGLPTPRVLAVSSPSKRVWIVEIGTFEEREKGEAARKKFATKDTAVVRSRVPTPSKPS